MARKLKSDKWLFIATLALVCTSVVMVYSASSVILGEKGESQYSLLMKQGAFAFVGLAFVQLIMRIDYRTYRQPVIIWTVLGLVAFALVVVLLTGRPINGATRWLDLGPIGLQPSELAKVAIVLFVAALLEKRMERIDEPAYALAPIGIVLGTVVGLIVVQPDLGTALSIVIIAAAMIFAAGISYRYIAAIALMGIPALAFLIYTSTYRMARIQSYLDPWADPLKGGYQAIQSMISVSVGGIFGRGLTDGLQKLFYLPEPHNDFIFAVIGEELGLVGATFILGCFCIIAWRGMRTALRAPDRFGTFLAIGLTTMVAFQALFNISVVLGLLPTKGIPLPFVSYGGSSLLINLIGMGILLNVSQHASGSQIVTMTLPTTADA
jgi:cell division protein FtsW